jgi:hypothetical protein
MKPEALIMDASAGNRTIWKEKDHKYILFCDIEPELDVKPDQIVDSRSTDFEDLYFNTIFFDPPHGWGKKPGQGIYECRNEEEYRAYKKKYNLDRWGNKAVYYGWDKYKTKNDLIQFIFDSQREFTRILKDNGMLWLKWNETKIPIEDVLSLFHDWTEMLRLPIGSPKQKFGSQQTYWVLFLKAHGPQATILGDFTVKETKKRIN